MINRMYAVYDKKVGAYMMPFASANDQSAERAFGNAVQNEQSVFSKNHEDYDLYFVGYFDDYKGVFAGDVCSSEYICPAIKFI